MVLMLGVVLLDVLEVIVTVVVPADLFFRSPVDFDCLDYPSVFLVVTKYNVEY